MGAVLARTILHTGPGGAGTTTAAAATAAHLASSGTRTLLLATGPGGDLGDVLGVDVPASGAPVGVAPGLEAARAGGQAALDGAWPALAGALAARGAHVSAGEPAPAPGLDHLAAALALHRALSAGEHAAIVVDAGPSAAALALLGVPDAARWWLARAVPQASRLAAAAPPLAGTGLGGLRRAIRGAVALGDLLHDPERTSARVVAAPGALAARRVRRLLTALALHAVPADAVLARAGAADPAGPRRLELPASAAEPVGAEALAALGAALFATADPLAVLTPAAAESLTIEPGAATLRLPLPFASRDSVHVRRVGGDLVVAVDGARRALPLPPVLEGYGPAGASYADGALLVTFTRTDDAPV
jgi:arsenite-transporting ATPase